MRPAKGRAVGVPNYKNDLLINVVEAVLPNGAALWHIVAKRYQESSGEANLREVQDIKRHFQTHRNLCNNGRKVTGSSAPIPSVARCQSIWRKILAKSAASNAGGKDSDASGSDSDSETDEEEGGLQNGSLHADAERPNIDNLFDDVPIPPIEYDEPHDEVNPIEQQSVPRRAAPARAPSPIPSLKRKTPLEEERGKSKNCRNTPRGSAGAALSSMADAYTRKLTEKQNGEPGMIQMMMMQMMQQQQQQQQQQFNNQLMMMMMNNQRPYHSNIPSSHSNYSNISRFSPSASSSSSSSSTSFDNMSIQNLNNRHNAFPDESDTNSVIADDTPYSNEYNSST